MKNLGYGKGYQYAHDTKEKVTNMQCMPDSLIGRTYYHPTDQGFEPRFKTRMEELKAWKRQHGWKG
jgi:putative ATPase